MGGGDDPRRLPGAVRRLRRLRQAAPPGLGHRTGHSTVGNAIVVVLVDDPRVDAWRCEYEPGKPCWHTDPANPHITNPVFADPGGSGRKMLAHFPGSVTLNRSGPITAVLLHGEEQIRRITLER